MRSGRKAEAEAERFLMEQGLRLLERNYRTRRGEIDLVMEDNATIVFVEVRFRTAGALVAPEESITAAKRKRISLAAAQYLARERHARDRPCRFDVVAISDELRWLKAAFEAQ